MLAVGVVGGIGSGKSTLADLLVAKGAVLIDSDQIAREVVEPGQPALAALVDAFGEGILHSDGSLNRKEMAKIAFSSDESLATLNSITHPVIGEVMTRRREEAADSNKVCLYAIPLFTPEHRDALSLDLVVVVDCDIETARERLIAFRGFTEQEADERIAAQIGRDERNGYGDIVISNSGGPQELQQAADQLWGTLSARLADHG